MKSARIAPALGLVLALSLLLAACSSSKKTQTTQQPPSGQQGWYSEKVKPPKKTLGQRIDETFAGDPARSQTRAERRAARRAQRAAEREAQQAREREADAAEAALEAQAKAARRAQQADRDEPNSAPPERSSARLERVLSAAESYLKTPYRFGGTSRQGIDCSGLMLVSFAEAGVKLPRTSAQQAQQGKRVERDELERGDLIFFATAAKGRVSHAGLVVSTKGGRVRFIHSSSSGGVRIDELSNSYWAPRYLWARRLID